MHGGNVRAFAILVLVLLLHKKCLGTDFGMDLGINFLCSPFSYSAKVGLKNVLHLFVDSKQTYN